jgi:hypothetical protein
MKILGKHLVSPIYIRLSKQPGRLYSSVQSYPILLKFGRRAIRILDIRRMSGSTETTTFSIHLIGFKKDSESREIKIE